MGTGGFYLMHRGWMANPVFQIAPFTEPQAWCWLIESAAFADHQKRIKSAVLLLQRGQAAASIRFMAAEWRWEQTRVRRFLNRLKSASMITTDTTTDVTIITICNYNIYQSSDAESATPFATLRATAAPQQRHKKEQRNKGTKETDSPEWLFDVRSEGTPSGDQFEKWWQIVPKKVGKLKAQRAFVKALKATGSAAPLIAGMRRYAAEVAGRDSQYIAHPTTWLNDERWSDDVPSVTHQVAEEDAGWLAAKAAGPAAMDDFIAKKVRKA